MISTRKDLTVSFCMIVPTGEAVEPSLSYSYTGIVRFQRYRVNSRVSFVKVIWCFQLILFEKQRDSHRRFFLVR